MHSNPFLFCFFAFGCFGSVRSSIPSSCSAAVAHFHLFVLSTRLTPVYYIRLVKMNINFAITPYVALERLEIPYAQASMQQQADDGSQWHCWKRSQSELSVKLAFFPSKIDYAQLQQ